MKPPAILKTICLLGTLLAIQLPAANATETGEGSTTAVDALVERLRENNHVPGVSIAVVKDGKLVLAKGYGQANVELAVPATADTVFQLASVSKTFTASAVMLLVRDGKLSLDDKLSARLTDLPAAWADVTVRQLLNHTSGIKSYTSVEGFDKLSRKDFSQAEILELVAKDPLEFTPGEKWNYSNTGYFLLGMLIEKASGKPYGEFMAERIFTPLGMDHTRLNDLREVLPGRAQGYEWNGQQLRNGEYVSPTQPFAAGALVSTVNDLVKWDAALANHALLDQATLEEMWTPTKLKEGEAGYGLGWQTGKTNDHRVVRHGGGIPGFSTELARYVDDGLTVIVLTNSDSGQAERFARAIAAHFEPALAEKRLEPIDDPAPETTKRLRGVLEGARTGEIEPENFTAQANEQLVPRIKEGKDRLAALGALTALQLLERKEEGDNLALLYRATFDKETLQTTFFLDKDGKIQGIRLQPED
jgi:CubicO group peptidase (beta-lactamase class C family)